MNFKMFYLLDLFLVMDEMELNIFLELFLIGYLKCLYFFAFLILSMRMFIFSIFVLEGTSEDASRGIE